MTGGAAILLLSTADWNAPLWTNKQYMACELAAGNDLTYVESLGIRRPQLTVRDARRIGSRLTRALQRPTRPETGENSPRPMPQTVTVKSPIIVPYHRGIPAQLNRKLLERAVRDWACLPRVTRLLWTYTPTTYGLHTASRTVYHCVDLLAEYPGIDPRVVADGERHLAASGAVAVASSREVAVHLRDVGFGRVLEWPNVADVSEFLTASGKTPVRESGLVVFGGNISPYKVDCELVAEVVRRCPGAKVIMAGPIAEGGGAAWPALDELRALGVHFVGSKSVSELATLYARASVAIIPYLVNGYTKGVLPLKVYEYLGAGLPVVSSSLPSLDPIAEHVFVAQSAAAFANTVQTLLDGPSASEVLQRQAMAREHSWATRGVEARALVRGLLEGDERG